MIISLFSLIFFNLKKVFRFYSNKKVLKDKKLINFDKDNLNNWMNLTKKERYKISKQESISYMIKRKVLLKEIRKEYKKISEEKSEKTNL